MLHADGGRRTTVSESFYSAGPLWQKDGKLIVRLVKHQIEVDAALAIDLKEQEHRRKGEIMECGCCFDDYTVHRITHCDGDTPHFFCHDCAQKNAKNGQ